MRSPPARIWRPLHILAGQNEEELYRSPLTAVGVDVKAGDYVLAINGEELKPDDDPYRLLRNKADAPVQLTVNNRPTMEGARVVSYRPVTDEQSLLYPDWVTGNMAMVDKLSGGSVVGITNRGTLIDGGNVNMPEFGFVNAKGEWVIEGFGVARDIEVENDPKSVIQGKDPQLERAVIEVMNKLKVKPGGLPSRPPAPVKTK
jgi:C-terminal processing protease CtpA/Prc